MVNINNSAPFSNTYIASGFGQITELDIGNEFLQDCVVPPLGVDCDGNSIDLFDNVLGKNIIVTISLGSLLFLHHTYTIHLGL